MKANPILLQKKYSRVIRRFADREGISLEMAFDFFIIQRFIRWSVMEFQTCIA